MASNAAGRSHSRERPDYYIAPTSDFTQYTKDYEEKYWSKDTAFEWQQDVADNLRAWMERLPRESLAAVIRLALPMVIQTQERHLADIRRAGLPLSEDGLKAIGECLPAELGTMARTLELQAPLARLGLPAARLRDQLVLLERRELELREQYRLGLYRSEAGIRRRASEAETREQTAQLDVLAAQIGEVRRALKRARAVSEAERRQLTVAVRAQLDALAPEVLAELEHARRFAVDIVASGTIPEDDDRLRQVRQLVCQRQLRGLKARPYTTSSIGRGRAGNGSATGSR